MSKIIFHPAHTKEKMEHQKILVTLETWEYEHGADVGVRRYTANWTKQDALHYQNKQAQEDNRTASVAASLCELAVAKHTNNYWSGHVWHHTEHHKYRDVPDVGRDIEVRRLRTRETAAIRRRQNDTPDLTIWVAKPIAPEFRQIELYGWITQKDAWQHATPSDYDPENTRLIHPRRLNDPKYKTDKYSVQK